MPVHTLNVEVGTVRQLLEQEAEEMAPWRERQSDILEQFRQSRLYVQIIAAVALIGVFLALYALPIESMRSALRWAVTYDADWRSGWARADGWAMEQGGWREALRTAWDQVAATVGWSSPAEGEQAEGAQPQDTEIAGSPPTEAPKSGALLPLEVGPSLRKVLPVDDAVLYGYGWRDKELHEGLDLVAGAGAPVHATSAGQVLRVVHRDPVWGGVVEIQHEGYTATYACLDAIGVRAGDRVTAGQRLAVIAAEPVAEVEMGAHLHLEVILHETGMPIDPAHFLSLQGSGT